MMKRSILFFYVVLQAFPASAGYVSYAQISTYRMPSQIMYISGVVDGITAVDERMDRCLTEKLKMSAPQITSNVLNFAAATPALHSLAMAQVVAAYLGEACPK